MIIFPNMKSIIGKKISTIPQKIIVGGAFTSYDGTNQNYITRLNSDGTRDTSFTIGTGFSAELFATAVQSDGKILAGGSFTTYNSIPSNCIARLYSNGDFDYDFNTTGAGNTVRSLEIQSDGKIVLGGNFVSFNGVSASRIVRIFSGGVTDGGFTIGTGFDNVVREVAIQSDGKIVVGGNFTAYNGTALNRIVRLNSDGTLDTGFTIGTGFISAGAAQVNTIAVQSDGKIVVGGTFTNYNGTTQNRITRLNSDGTRDTGFTIAAGFNGNVNAIAIQSNGKIVAVGNFTTYQGVNANRIIRLNSDGTRDTGFTIGTGFGGIVNTLAIQSNSKIVVGGGFLSYNGTLQYYITRLNSDGTLDTGFTTGTRFGNSVNSVTLT
jgi:uncharacterized delta-60 repeat protein